MTNPTPNPGKALVDALAEFGRAIEIAGRELTRFNIWGRLPIEDVITLALVEAARRDGADHGARWPYSSADGVTAPAADEQTIKAWQHGTPITKTSVSGTVAVSALADAASAPLPLWAVFTPASLSDATYGLGDDWSPTIVTDDNTKAYVTTEPNRWPAPRQGAVRVGKFDGNPRAALLALGHEILPGTNEIIVRPGVVCFRVRPVPLAPDVVPADVPARCAYVHAGHGVVCTADGRLGWRVRYFVGKGKRRILKRTSGEMCEAHAQHEERWTRESLAITYGVAQMMPGTITGHDGRYIVGECGHAIHMDEWSEGQHVCAICQRELQ